MSEVIDPHLAAAKTRSPLVSSIWSLVMLVVAVIAVQIAPQVASAAQVQHLNTQTTTATGAGATGVPSIASFTIPSGKNRALFIWASFERDHCSNADATGGLCVSANTAGTGLGDNYPEPRVGTPPATTTNNQLTARVVGPGGTINKQNALVIGGTPSGDTRFIRISTSPTGSPAGTAFFSLDTFHIVLFETEIATLLGGAASGTVSISLPDTILPSNPGDDAMLLASVFQNVEQTATGFVRNATATAQVTTGTPGNFSLAPAAYDAGQAPDEPDDGKLVMATNSSTEGFVALAGHVQLATMATTNNAGTYDTPNGNVNNEPNGFTGVAFFRNGGATPGSLYSLQAAGAAATLVYGGTNASFLLESDNADVGDAPISYGNASHTIGGIRLGALVDADASLLNNATATGDDVNGVDDEDGVSLTPLLPAGETTVVPVSIQNAGGFLSVWFDWNGDGDFNDPGEQMITAQAVTVGTVNLNIAVPLTAVIGPTFARFRVCTNNTALDNCSTPSGTVQSGEVEDYQFQVARALTLRKTTVGGVGGTFSFALTNTEQTTGTVTTTVANTPTTIDGNTGSVATLAYTIVSPTTAVTINESSLPPGWQLSGATCVNSANATVGSLTGNTYTITGAEIGASVSFTCTFTNTKLPILRLQKALAGARFAATDQFNLTVAGTGGPATVTTTGSGATATGVATLNPGAVGAVYTLSEAGAAGANLANYATSYACTNALSGGQTPSGTGITFNITAVAGDDITCTFTNAAITQPLLSVTKTASASPWTVGVAASYTLQLSNTGTATTTAVSTITDTIPTGLTIGTLPAGCSAAGQTVTCTVAAGLAAAGSTSFVIPVTPTVAAQPSVTNTASVSGGGDGGCPAAARCTSTVGPTAVGAAPIVASPDSGTVPNGGNGGVAVPNVLANDTLNGNPATLATVTLTQVSTTNPNVTLNPATGAVSVAPGTPAGTYTVTYRICEQLNPTNCSTSTVTVTVGAALIDAADNSFSANGSSGTTTASVLGNDTLNGSAVTVGVGGNSTLTPGAAPTPAAGSITMNPNGTITVAPGTVAGTYLYPYTICEVLNPTNCDTATATVVVGAAPIVAQDDTNASVNGATGGVAYASVLANNGNGVDTLNGVAATVGVGGNVTISLLVGAPELALTPSTGSVSVAPGTPTGTYTLTYQICEVLNPTNCDSAIASVVVSTSPINAVNDTGSVANGAAGGTAVPNVLVNDTLNGNPATLATVTLTQVSTTNPNVALNPATGAVSVAPGTPAGTYTVTYQICEQLNPTNCDTATTTVTVGAAPIDAVNDSFGPIVGASGGTTGAVLANDTLGGNAVSVGVGGNVTLTPGAAPTPAVGSITMNPNGTITVAPGTVAGTYLYPYTICEVLNPTNCDTATTTVTVGAAPIDAVNDTGTVANGAAGGVAVPNVLVNDTLNGVPATLATVVLTQTATTNPNVTLNPATGAVSVAPGTPAGTYTVTYRICEQLNPTNCDTATTTVTVGAAPIDAVNDTGSVANGAAGGTAVPNVLVNDTLNGNPATLATVTLTQVSTTNPNVTLNPATGAVSVAPGTPAGTYTVTYRICEQLNPTNCDTATTTVTVGAAPIVASPDSGAPIQGVSGGTAVPNVLVNDTLNGAPATLTTVILTQVSTTNPNVTLNPATGAVSVAPNTPAGTYTVVYQICEPLNPTNCSTTNVTVIVNPTPIVATNDIAPVTGSVSGGVLIPNVLVNDTLNGAPATLSSVTLTQVSSSNPGVTLNPATGAVSVAPGTPPGSYTLTYQICEQLNPTNCATATVQFSLAALIVSVNSLWSLLLMMIGLAAIALQRESRLRAR